MKEPDKKYWSQILSSLPSECREALGPGGEKENAGRGYRFEVLWVDGDKEYKILVVVEEQRKMETMAEGK